jgi:hypothetical protein
MGNNPLLNNYESTVPERIPRTRINSSGLVTCHLARVFFNACPIVIENLSPLYVPTEPCELIDDLDNSLVDDGVRQPLGVEIVASAEEAEARGWGGMRRVAS